MSQGTPVHKQFFEEFGGNIQLKAADDIDFQQKKAIAMIADNGATLPSTPVAGQWFLHTPTGRKILYLYDGSDWQTSAIISFGTMALFVDEANGADEPDKGFGVTTNAFATRQYAYDTVPVDYTGAVTITDAGGTTSENFVARGKWASGNFGITLNGVLTQEATDTISGGATIVKGSGSTLGRITDAGKFAVDASSTVDADSASGGSVVNVASTTGFTVGSTVVINPGGAREEAHMVQSISAGVSLTIYGILDNTHTAVQADEVTQGSYNDLLIYIVDNDEYRAVFWNNADILVLANFFGTTPVATDTWEILSPDSELDGGSGVAFVANGTQKGVIVNNFKFTSSGSISGTADEASKLELNNCFGIGSWNTNQYATLVAQDCFIKGISAGIGPIFSSVQSTLDSRRCITKNTSTSGSSLGFVATTTGHLITRGGISFGGKLYGFKCTQATGATLGGRMWIIDAGTGIFADTNGAVVQTTNVTFVGVTTNTNTATGGQIT